jgi:Holliday junction resolvase RusA-like endonuclease
VTTPNALTVFVAGLPKPQGSKNARPIYRGRGQAREFTGRVAQVESAGPAHAVWRADVRAALLDDHGQPRTRLDGPVTVALHFVLPRPASASPRRPTPPATARPDLDKLVRAVLDAITSAGIWADDAGVTAIFATKRRAEVNEPTGCHITIEGPTP